MPGCGDNKTLLARQHIPVKCFPAMWAGRQESAASSSFMKMAARYGCCGMSR